MKRGLYTTIYTVAFLPYILIAPPLDGIFLAAYVTAVVFSLLFPLHNRVGPLASASGRYAGVVVAIGAVSFISGQMIVIAGLFLGDPSKYVGSLFVFLSLIPVVLAPFRLSRMRERVKTRGIEGFAVADETQSILDHFFLDFFHPELVSARKLFVSVLGVPRLLLLRMVISRASSLSVLYVSSSAHRRSLEKSR